MRNDLIIFFVSLKFKNFTQNIDTIGPYTSDFIFNYKCTTTKYVIVLSV